MIGVVKLTFSTNTQIEVLGRGPLTQSSTSKTVCDPKIVSCKITL